MGNSRVFKSKGNVTTQAYKKGIHNGIDLVGTGYTLDYIIAHSAGTVVAVRSNYTTNDTTGSSYGNYVKIKHTNGYYTLYAHMKYGSVAVKTGDKVTKGQTIGYMGNTGRSTGAHLHFEVRDKSDSFIDPTSYIDADLPSTSSSSSSSSTTTSKPSYKVGTNYTTQVILKVRSGAGTNYSQKTYSQLTTNAKANAYSSGSNAGCLKKETIVTCQEVKNVGNDIWIKIPSRMDCSIL